MPALIAPSCSGSVPGWACRNRVNRQDGGTRAYRDVFTACSDKPIPGPGDMTRDGLANGSVVAFSIDKSAIADSTGVNFQLISGELSIGRSYMSTNRKSPSDGYEGLSLPRRLVAITFVICALWYLGWRATTLNPEAYIFSWVLYGAELFGFLTAMLHLFMTWRLTVRNSPVVPAGMSVDVFIPTINESAAIVRRTLMAARHMDYPHETWLLDDGNRPEMARLAAELGCPVSGAGRQPACQSRQPQPCARTESGRVYSDFRRRSCPAAPFPGAYAGLLRR